MPVYNKRGILLLPKVIVLNPKDGSRQSVSGKGDVGKQVVGYYAPNRPDIITENRPGKPVFGGFLCFFGVAVCLIFSILVFTGMIVSC